MKIASVAEVKARLSAYLKESEKGPVIVTRNGKAVAILLAVTDEEELERLLAALLARCETMLRLQIAVFHGTKDLDKAIQAQPDKKPVHEQAKTA